MNISSTLEAVSDVEFRLDEPLARHTTFRVGGPVRLLARPRSESALCALLDRLRDSGVPLVVLGGGSNVLALDGPREMAVIQLYLACSELLRSGQRTKRQTIVYAGGGQSSRSLSNTVSKMAWRGLSRFREFPAQWAGRSL